MQQGPRQRGCLLDPRRGSSQGVLLGAQSLDPTEVRGSSPLDRAEPGRVQTCADRCGSSMVKDTQEGSWCRKESLSSSVYALDIAPDSLRDFAKPHFHLWKIGARGTLPGGLTGGYETTASCLERTVLLENRPDRVRSGRTEKALRQVKIEKPLCVT